MDSLCFLWSANKTHYLVERRINMKFDKATVLTIAAGLLTLTGALVSNVASNENSKKTDYVSRKEFEELAKKIKSN